MKKTFVVATPTTVVQLALKRMGDEHEESVNVQEANFQIRRQLKGELESEGNSTKLTFELTHEEELKKDVIPFVHQLEAYIEQNKMLPNQLFSDRKLLENMNTKVNVTLILVIVMVIIYLYNMMR